MSVSGTHIAVASGFAVATAVTGAVLLAASTKKNAATAGESEQFPRPTEETERDTLETLKLDHIPPTNKKIQLRQNRGEVAREMYDKKLKSSKARGERDHARRVTLRSRCEKKLVKFRTRESFKASNKASSKKIFCSCCQDQVKTRRYFAQNDYDLCQGCSDACFACERKFDSPQRYVMTLEEIDAGGLTVIEADQLDGKTAKSVAPQALVCEECMRFLQSNSCSQCRRIVRTTYGGKCEDCSRQICVGCKKAISGGSVITRPKNEDLKEVWCKSCHEQVSELGLECFCCGRMDFRLHGELQLRPVEELAGHPAVDSPSGRFMCLDCAHPDQQPVTSSEQATSLWRESILPYFKSKGLDIAEDVLEEIPIIVVDSDEMFRLSMNESDRGGNGTHECTPKTLGLTLSRTTTRVTSVGRSKDGSMVHEDHQLNSVATSPVESFSHTHLVTGIALLFGLPIAAAGEVLAHEFIHAYHALFEERPDPSDKTKVMTKAVSEGTAQLGAYFWLSDCVLNPRYLALKRLRLQSIETHTDPAYGEGFLKAREAFGRITCRRWLVFSGAPFHELFQHTIKHGKLP